MRDAIALAGLLDDGNVKAFARVIREGESNQTEDAYTLLFGGNHFNGWLDHPRQAIMSPWGWTSAAGAYQAMCAVPGKVKTDTWGDCVRAIGLKDFTPKSQDIFYAWCVDRRHALDDVIAGRFAEAVRKCNREWASLPGSPYGQPVRTMAQAEQTYLDHGGLMRPQGEPAPVETRDIPTETIIVAPDGSAQPAQPPKEPTMATASDVLNSPFTKFALAAFNPLLAAAPEFIKLFLDKDTGQTVPERNATAVVKMLDVAQQALQASGHEVPNAQAVAELIESDPRAKEVARAAMLGAYFEITEAGGGGIDGARKADAAAMAGDGPWWQALRSPSFWALLLLLPLVYLIVLSIIGVVGEAEWSADVRAAIAGTIVGTIVGGAVGYYWGQTTSRNRTPAT
jgi:muramidase (phage lysozyme)